MYTKVTLRGGGGGEGGGNHTYYWILNVEIFPGGYTFSQG